MYSHVPGMPAKCVKVHSLQEVLICPVLKYISPTVDSHSYHQTGIFYSVKNVTKVTHQHLLGEKNPHSVLTMPDFINAREAQRQTGFIQMDYEVQGNSFIGTKTKQRALFLLILEKNSHSLC